MQKTALISVFDKTGIQPLAEGLKNLGYRLVSSGGTARYLKEAGLEVSDVQDLTHFPECLAGRVKTLHPHVHAGILARRDQAEDCRFLEERGIASIDIVIVNLYPFVKTAAQETASFEDCIEQIDIGGPTLLRAAAKNHKDVLVVVDPQDYQDLLEALLKNEVDLSLRRYLAGKVFQHTARYEAAIADFFANDKRALPQEGVSVPKISQADLKAATVCELDAETKAFPKTLDWHFELKQPCRYGENSQQAAAWYVQKPILPDSLAAAVQLHGKELSYNNIADVEAALSMVQSFQAPTVVAVKHQNPCGIASRACIEEAWQACYEADSVSIFGGIIALNREVTLPVAEAMKAIFLEVILAPSFTEEALTCLSQKKNLRLLALPGLSQSTVRSWQFRSLRSGLLIQQEDHDGFDETQLRYVTRQKGDADFERDADFGMRVVRHVKSNAIVLVKNQQTVGIGPGQTNRIGALEIALRQAGPKAEGAVLASDAFFPFDDCVKLAAEHGIAGIVQPGGSVRDEDSIQAADERGLVMMFTGQRHFKH